MTSQSAIDIAMAQLGVEYVLGGEQPGVEFDCSGLVQYAYRKAGFKLPRTADQQYHATQRISAAEAQPGDLVYFLDGSGHAYHTGIYLGNGKFLEAPHSGDVVKIANVNTKNVVFGRVGGYQVKFGQQEAVNLANDPTDYVSYGYVSALADSVPELKQLLDKAAKLGYSPQRFEDALQTTAWWKTHSDTAKKYIAMQKQDPAQYKQELTNATTHVRQIAAQLGVKLTSAQISHLATTDLFSGLDDATLTQSIGSLFTSAQGAPGGQAVSFQQQIQQAAAAYGVPVTQGWVDGHIRTMLATGVGMESVVQDLINQAKSAYPSLAQQLESGQTLQQIAQPYTALMSQTLEIPDSNIGLSDPSIQKALTGNAQLAPTGAKSATAPAPGASSATGGALGVPVPATAPASQPMSLYDFQNQLRNDPRWERTDNAKQTAYGLLHSIGRQWGFAS